MQNVIKLQNVAGIVAYVKDTVPTADFYEALGFTIDKREPDHLSIHLARFSYPRRRKKPDFQRETLFEPKGAGSFLYTKVDDVDAYYQSLLTKGLKPSSAPKDWPWGNSEFIIRDPDGYKLVFFNLIKPKRSP